jgi:hypothetical protein
VRRLAYVMPVTHMRFALQHLARETTQGEIPELEVTPIIPTET